MASQVISFATRVSKAFGAITASYTDLGAAFTVTPRLIKVVNTTDADIDISYDDGASDNDVAPAHSIYVYDGNANRNAQTNQWVFRVGTQVQIKYQTVPTEGAVYLVTAYGQGE
jgi:hypothetical protein